MSQPIIQVDAFTDHPFAGNPAGVCVLNAPANPEWMQQVASEMNVAETAFLAPLAPKGAGYQLRWFTPAQEVDLCGHATLASAHVLWSDDHLAAGQQARFHTLSGLLTADKRGDWIELDFPAEPASTAAAPPELLEALGVEPISVGRNRVDYIVEVASETIVHRLHPDMRLLNAVQTRGVIVTSRSDAPDSDFISRFFAPSVGIPEDPVTGSAHCCLGPFWSERLGKDELVGYQASVRGGIVRVRPVGDRVKLLGQAVTVIRGELAAAAERR